MKRTRADKAIYIKGVLNCRPSLIWNFHSDDCWCEAFMHLSFQRLSTQYYYICRARGL